MYVIRCSKRSQCSYLRKGLACSALRDLAAGFFTCWSAFLIVNIQPLGNCSSLINLDRMHDLTRNVFDESSMRYWWMELMRLISMLAALHVLMTCQFIERSLWQVRPRFKQETNVIKTVLSISELRQENNDKYQINFTKCVRYILSSSSFFKIELWLFVQNQFYISALDFV